MFLSGKNDWEIALLCCRGGNEGRHVSSRGLLPNKLSFSLLWTTPGAQWGSNSHSLDNLGKFGDSLGHFASSNWNAAGLSRASASLASGAEMLSTNVRVSRHLLYFTCHRHCSLCTLNGLAYSLGHIRRAATRVFVGTTRATLVSKLGLFGWKNEPP
jgi:hypothetical protein